MTHTPGPWEVDDANPAMVFTAYPVEDNGARQYICDCPPDCTTDAETTPREEAIANARLIAAAPQLLEALKALIVPFNQRDGTTGYTINYSAIPHARAAIAAAEEE